MGAKYILGLDIGTTKVCAVVAKAEGESAEIIGAGITPSRGMKKGVVVDMEAATASVARAVSLAGKSSGVELKAAYVGVAGGHILCQESYGATGIKGKEVTRKDVDRVIEAASTVFVPLEREVLHVLPTDFTVDGQGGVARPLGMSGVRLEANVRVITASQAALENLVRCCEDAGITVIEIIFEPIASFKAVARTYEAASAVAVVDIGGGTTDVAVYREGGLRHASVLPVGGGHLTNDIAIGLKVSTDEAERVKKEYGYALWNGKRSGPEEMEVMDLDGERKKMPARYLGEILLPRCEEIFELIGEEIRRALLYTSSSCVVLTGGAALLEGLDRVAEAKLGVPVRVGLPANASAPALRELTESPMYSTSVGLMLYGLQAERGVYDDLVLGLREKLKKVKKGFAGVFAFTKTPQTQART
jgi:cell division protein FtsA